MSGFGLRKNTVFEWNGDRFRIDRVQADGDIVIERVDDGVFSIVKERSLFSEYVKGAITVPEAGLRPSWNIPAYGRPIEDLPACMRTEAARRRRYLEAVLAAGRPVFVAAYLKPLLKDAALKIGDKTPPSISSFYRWYQRYRQHGDFRCLVPRWDRRGSRDSRQAARIGELLLDATAEAYLASPIATVANIFKRLGTKIDAANRAALNGEQLKLPNLRTV